MPADLQPEAVAPQRAASDVDDSLGAILLHWRLVVADMGQFFGTDLYDPAVRARPCQGVRTMIFALLDMPESRLRRALIIRR